PDEKLSRTRRVQPLDVRGNRTDGVAENWTAIAAGRIDRKCVANVIAAHLDDVQRLEWSGVAGPFEKRIHLRGQVEIDAVVIGSRSADCKVGRIRIGKCGTNTAAQPDGARELFDPGRTVAEVVAALRVGCTGNEKWIQHEIRWRPGISDQREGVARVRQARTEDH